MKSLEFIIFLFSVALHGCRAFHTTPWQIERHPIGWSSRTTRLFGKGFRGAKNKQATLAQKLEEAKKQNNQNNGSDNDEMEESIEQEEEDAHAEFARLLAQNPPKKPPKETPSKASSSLFNLTPKKPKKNAPTKTAAAASRKSKKARQDTKSEQDEQEQDPIRQVGDKAQRRDFEYLVDPVTNQPLGPVRAAQLVPWVPPFLTDYLVIVADPRPLSQTNDWKLAVQYLHSQQQQFHDNDRTTTTTFLAICASDSPKEVLAWKQQRFQDSQDDDDNDNNNNPFTILMDSSSLDWMTTYGCVGAHANAHANTLGSIPNPWSLHILILDSDGIIRFHKGGVDPSKVCPMVRDAISSSFST